MDPCKRCGKPVHPSEARRYDGIYHIKCFSDMANEVKEKERSKVYGANLTYHNDADVKAHRDRAETAPPNATPPVVLQQNAFKFCTECGHKTTNVNAKFCGSCGKTMSV